MGDGSYTHSPAQLKSFSEASNLREFDKLIQAQAEAMQKKRLEEIKLKEIEIPLPGDEYTTAYSPLQYNHYDLQKALLAQRIKRAQIPLQPTELIMISLRQKTDPITEEDLFELLSPEKFAQTPEDLEKELHFSELLQSDLVDFINESELLRYIYLTFSNKIDQNLPNKNSIFENVARRFFNKKTEPASPPPKDLIDQNLQDKINLARKNRDIIINRYFNKKIRTFPSKTEPRRIVVAFHGIHQDPDFFLNSLRDDGQLHCYIKDFNIDDETLYVIPQAPMPAYMILQAGWAWTRVLSQDAPLSPSFDLI